MLNLFGYQDKSVNDIRNSFRNGNKAPLFVLPTGGGKTVVFCYIAATAAAKGTPVLILVHRIELIRQTSMALIKAGVNHGIIHPDYKPRDRELVQVASVQTLSRRLDKVRDDFGLIIVDEAHHANASTWTKIIKHYDTNLLGVTATPVRADGKGLGKAWGGHFDDMILGPSPKWLMTNVNPFTGRTFLVEPRIIYPGEGKFIDVSGLDVERGDFKQSQLEGLLDKPAIIGDVVSHYQHHCPGVPAVAFCVSVNHAKHVAEEFRRAGYRAYSVDGAMEDDVRKRILDGLGNGSVDVVCSCDIISEGTDIPAIGCAILLRPTLSVGLYIQQAGRTLRSADGKMSAIIIDHVGNVSMHGPPQMYREWSLEGVMKKPKPKKDDEAVKVDQCPNCAEWHMPAPECPACHYVYPVKEFRKLEFVAGQLKEMSQEEIDAFELKKKRKREENNAVTLEQLYALAKERGYKPAWAEYRFKNSWRNRYVNQS